MDPASGTKRKRETVETVAERDDPVVPVDVHPEKRPKKEYSSPPTAFVATVEKRLATILGKNSNELRDFRNALESTGAVIAGSFVTQCILGGKLRASSDIDIFVSEDTYELLFAVLRKYMCYKDEERLEMEEYEEFSELVETVEEFEFGGTVFQVIQVGVEKDMIKQFVYDAFDFDICKCIYSIEGGKAEVSYKDLNTILTKTCPFECTNRPVSTVERYYKYVKRGFTFTFGSIPITELFRDHVKESIPNFAASEVDESYLFQLLGEPFPTPSAIKGDV